MPSAPAKAPGNVSKRYGDILAKLDHLRSLTIEVCRTYVANIERDIVKVEDMVVAMQQQSRQKKKVPVSALDETAEILNTLSLKPQKGRRGNLKKIEKAVLTMKRILSQEKP